ncbi:MAG: hypothetical protein HYZ34_02965 [Ignavibacteriae bacterium]|nr:hypothetical protein [Ignavibacteriota bacterium]
MNIDDDNLLDNLSNEMSDEERDLRLRNQLKKIELTAKYDAHFMEGESKVPASVEQQWLSNIEAFERQAQNPKRTTVKAFAGNPSCKLLSEISEKNLEEEVERLLNLLATKNIVVDFLCDVPAADAYRFLTEELLEVEIDDIQIEGMNHHFIYEEFHPNDEYDAKQCAEDFLSSLFWLESEMFSHRLARNGLLDSRNQPVTKEEMLKTISDFRASFISFERPQLQIVSCVVEGDNAVVNIQTEWSGLVNEQSPPVRKFGISTLRLVRCEYGGFDIIQALVPGWNCE